MTVACIAHGSRCGNDRRAANRGCRVDSASRGSLSRTGPTDNLRTDRVAVVLMYEGAVVAHDDGHLTQQNPEQPRRNRAAVQARRSEEVR